MNFLKRILGGSTTPKAPPTFQLPQGGDFPMEVVGESNYQDNLEKVCGPRSSKGENRIVEARLVLENTNSYDKNAVRVEINGLLVGYLNREVAVQYRTYLQRRGYSALVGQCQARIKGGWKRGKSDIGSYGVKLDVVLK